MPRVESVDELFANIDIHTFIADYNSGVSNSDLKKRYGIFSHKSLNNFINSLIALRKIKRRDSPEKTKEIKNLSEKTISDLLTSKKGNRENLSALMENKLANEVNELEDFEIELMLLQYKNEGFDENFTEAVTDETNECGGDKIPEDNIFSGNDVKVQVEHIKEFDDLGLSEFYISNLLEISLQKLKKIRQQFNLVKSGHVYQIDFNLKKIKQEIDDLKLQKYLLYNNNASFMDILTLEFGYTIPQLESIIEKSLILKKCRLEYSFHGLNTTATTTRIYHRYSYQELVFLNKTGLILKIADILLEKPNDKIMQFSWIIDILKRLSFENDDDYVEFDDNDARTMLRMMCSKNYRKKIIHGFTETGFQHEQQLNELQLKLQNYKSIIPRLKKIEEMSKKNSKQYQLNTNDEELIFKIQKAIVNILEIKKEIGLNATSLTILIKKTFDTNIHLVRHCIMDLLEREIISKIKIEGVSFWVLKQYHKDLPQIENRFIHGRSITNEQFLSEISLLEKKNYSRFENSLGTRIAGLFLVNGYSILPQDLDIKADLIVEKGNISSYIFVFTDHNYPSKETVLNCYGIVPHKAKLIIIILGHITSDLIELAKNLEILIIHKNNFNELLYKNKEPALINSVIVIRDGLFEGQYGVVMSNDFQRQLQQVKLIGSDNIVSIFYGDLQELPASSNQARNLSQFVQFIQILRNITTPDELEEGLQIKLNTNEIKISTKPHYFYEGDTKWNYEKFTNRNFSAIFNHVQGINYKDDTCNIKLNFIKDLETGFLYFDSEKYNDTPRDFCVHNIVNCNCFAWLDQNEDMLFLCRHIVSLLLGLWDTVNNDELYATIKKLRFFCHDSFVIYNFFVSISKLDDNALFDLVRRGLVSKQDQNYGWLSFEGILKIQIKMEKSYNKSSYNINLEKIESDVSFLLKKYVGLNEIFERIPSGYLDAIIKTYDEIINYRPYK